MFPNLDATYLVAMGNQQGLAKKGLSGQSGRQRYGMMHRRRTPRVAMLT